MLAGVAALIGAGLAKLGGAERTEASHGPSDAVTALHVGQTSNAAGATTYLSVIQSAPTSGGLAIAMGAQGTPPSFTRGGKFDAIRGETFGDDAAGVYGKATDAGFGVYGTHAEGTGFGVKGETTGTGAGVRAFGQGNGIGLWADATARVGIFGTSTATTGIFGVSKASNPNGTVAPNFPSGVAGQGFGRIGVLGISDTNVGVQGNSTSGVGVYGFSQDQIGLRGDSTSNYGVYGTSGLTALRGEASGGGVGFVGIALNPGAGGLAGAFFGGVTVQGSFTVTGGAKSAAVPHPDGTYRRVYCQESTEAWFEDFGSVEIRNGRADVPLDPDFDAVVKGDDYMVFLTEVGDCGGLFVGRKGPHRFEIRSRGGTAASGSCDYRVVSRRRESVGARLEKIDVKGPPTPKSPPQRVGPDGRLMDVEHGQAAVVTAGLANDAW